MEGEQGRVGPGGGRDAFLRLIHWECRHLQGRRPGVWWLSGTAAALSIAATAWWAAYHPDQGTGTSWLIQLWPQAVLVLTPFSDSIAWLGQMSFGYGLLRFTSDGAVALTHLVLPVVVAGIVVH